MEIAEDKLKWLEQVQLGKGNHESLNHGVCVMEAVAYMAGEDFTDHPACASPIISVFLRRWNDDLDDAGRQMLKPYVLKLIGTKASDKVEDARAWLICDWMVRQHTPAWLDLAGCKDQAAALRALPEITKATCHDAAPAIKSAQKKANAARAAVWDAAGAAAGDAAGDAARAAAGDAVRAAVWAAAGAAAGAAVGAAVGDAAGAAAWDAAVDAAWTAARAAAWDAARDAARAAARDAARAAAWDAARDAARAAARDALKPTVTSIQASALVLLDRMIELRDLP